MKSRILRKFLVLYNDQERNVSVKENGKILDVQLKFTKPDLRTASLDLPQGQYLLHKTGFLNSEIYIKRKFRKTPGFDIVYNWRLNATPLTISGKEYYIVPRDFEGKKYTWMENKILPVLDYEIMNKKEVSVEKINEAGDDLLFLMITGFFIIFVQGQRKT